MSAFTTVAGCFNSALNSVNIVVVFNTIVTSNVGSANTTADVIGFFVGGFGNGYLRLTPSLANFVVDVPIFNSVTVVLGTPVSTVLTGHGGLNVRRITPFIGLNLALARNLIPPAPNVLTISVLLNTSVNAIVVVNLVYSIVSFIIYCLNLHPICTGNRCVTPLPRCARNVRTIRRAGSMGTLLVGRSGAPDSNTSFLPLLLPTIVVTVNSVNGLFSTRNSTTCDFFGAFNGAILTLFVNVVTINYLVFNHGSGIIGGTGTSNANYGLARGDS